MIDPTGIVASTWVTLDPQYRDRPLWWRSLWIAHLTKLRTGRVGRDFACWSTEYAHQLYLERGGEFKRYIPRRQRKESMSTAAQDDTLELMKKNPAAVALGKRRAKKAKPGELSDLGRIGGLAGGAARAKALSKARRVKIAKKAAAARWRKKA